MVERKNNKQKNRTKYFLPGGKKQIQAVCAFLFLGVLILSCGVNLMHKDRQMSEKEMRMLAQKPEISLSGIASGRFMEQYEEYVSDQFAGRDTWVRIKTFADSVAGRTEEGGVFKGKDHYLMEDVAVADESDLKENLDAMKNFKERYPDIQMHMMLVPNAANVMEDKLPAFAVTASQSRQISRVKAELGDSYDWIDAEKVLDAHKDEAIYYHTDHHWTSLGAWYAFQGAKTQLGLDKSEEIKMKAYAVSDSFNGTLSAKSGYETDYKEPIYIYLPKSADAPQVAVNYVEEQKKSASMYDSSKLDERDQYSVFFGGNHAMIDIQSTQTEKRRLLVFKDSYANCFLPLLAPYYREIVVIDPRYYTGKLSSVMSDKQFDDVLFLYNANTFFEDRMLAGVLDENSQEKNMANKIEKQFLDTENKGPVRLNKYLSEAGVCSRREADKLIAAGQVTVDGVRAETGMKVEPWQVVRIGKKQVSRQEEMIVLAVNKPRGIVCTEERRERDSIVRFLNYPVRITYVGRLDKDSEGLLLMTNNGDIINRMMRAANKHEKEYKVTVDKPVTDKFLKEMAGGVPILDTVTRPCQVEKLGKYKFKIILTQGLNRQIRRMCEALGYEVKELRRVRIMNIELGNLKPGEYRKVTDQELNELYELIRDSKSEPTPWNNN